MRRKIYVHTSNREYLESFMEDENFEPISVYDSFDYAQNLQYEYGRIKTHQNYIHLIFGKMPQDDCPWCGNECKMVRIENPDDSLTLFCECIKCDSRGPSITFRQAAYFTTDHYLEIEDMVRQRFKRRRQWDDRLLDRLTK